MVGGMATQKLTITLDEEDVKKIRVLVAQHKAASVSGFVRHAVTIALHDVAGWGTMLAGALARTGGPLTKEERAWADDVLATTTTKRTRNRKAA